MISAHNVPYALKCINDVFKQHIPRSFGFSQPGNFKEESASGVGKSPAAASIRKCLAGESCLARALLSKQIDTQKFFQLSRCIRNLTEEDLLFLSERIEPGNISRDEDYVDDYRALGLIYETDEGFSYSKRAFELKKYALCYETHIEIPDSFPPKYEPFVGQAISGDEINALTGEVNQLKENQQWKTHM